MSAGEALTITLPTAPADKSRVEIKMINTSGSNTVTISTGGSDVFNKTGGSTSATLSLLNQAVMLQYAASSAIWYVQSDDLPLSQLDSRYLQETVYDPAAIQQQVLGTTATQAFSNKRYTRRVVTVTQSATPSINTDNTDIASITGLAQTITSMSTNLTGTPNAGDMFAIQITDSGTARSITWGSSFEASTVSLPTATSAGVMLMVGFTWNAATSKWRCIAVA